mmetsp:Transcript_4269/g.10375  ORF Transcript_4269/g.10375 Transcript_4269/m.10375 type:complete len:226 (+) Transcript_4269:828-1505(+)
MPISCDRRRPPAPPKSRMPRHSAARRRCSCTSPHSAQATRTSTSRVSSSWGTATTRATARTRWAAARASGPSILLMTLAARSERPRRRRATFGRPRGLARAAAKLRQPSRRAQDEPVFISKLIDVAPVGRYTHKAEAALSTNNDVCGNLAVLKTDTRCALHAVPCDENLSRLTLLDPDMIVCVWGRTNHWLGNAEQRTVLTNHDPSDGATRTAPAPSFRRARLRP